jgi:hypothetical protein
MAAAGHDSDFEAIEDICERLESGLHLATS